MRPWKHKMSIIKTLFRECLEAFGATEVANRGFQSYMKSIGKLGGQNKSTAVKRQKNSRCTKKATRP